MKRFLPEGEEIDLAEPYGSLLALLADLHEMAELHPAKDEFAKQVLRDLKIKIETLAAVVIAAANG